MTFRQFLESFEAEPEEGFYGRVYRVPLASDSFLHFTLGSRAKQIMASRRLMIKPPYQKFGTDSVDAISANYGKFVPGVQLTHIQVPPNDILVCLQFQTNVKPYAAYPEEVKWNADVPLMNARVTSVQGAKQILQQPNPFRSQIKPDEEYELRYV